jgi:purine-nucleoside phosphorylase
MLERTESIARFLKSLHPIEPTVGIILGSGLSHLSDKIEVHLEIPYQEIQDFPVSTVAGHAGTLVFGKFAGRQIVAMKGRFHFYEGYPMEDIALPVRVMKLLGIRYLVISNAAGGVHPAFKVGDIMLINDHINLMGTNPLIGKNIDSLGPRFPDMSAVYDPELLVSAEKVASSLGIPVQKGVYAAVTGPTYETPAEYRFIRTIGADAVGMSTIPEAIVAHHMGIKILAMSVITDLGIDGHIQEITHEEVIRAAAAAEPSLTSIITGVLRDSLP